MRVTDDFMHAVETDAHWSTHAVLDGETVETLRAREIFRAMAEAAHLCGDPGIQYDTIINDWHTSANSDRIYASNPCSEYMFLNDTACNLASLNLMKFVRDDGEFDIDAYGYAARLTITAQEILVDNASYPTPRIEENSHRFRPLGLGYANLGALLMSRGLAYDSDEGRHFAAALTAIMHGEAYRQSAIIARDHGGPVHGLPAQRAAHAAGHRQAPRRGVRHRRRPACPKACSRPRARSTTRRSSSAREYGYRNAQVTVLAPTGTIAFMMDCDTTGIEPDIALIKYKKLVGEGFLKIVNQTVPARSRSSATRRSRSRRSSSTSTSARRSRARPASSRSTCSVFDCAFKPVNGERSIHYMGHVRMMAAVQPFISGAISKTVNMPEAATVEDIEQVYLEGWKLGLKAIAIYRDNSKRSQPLSTGKKADGEVVDTAEVEELKKQLAAAVAESKKPHRRRLPAERTRGHPQVRHRRPRGLHHGRALPGRPARRDLPQDGQGGLHGLGTHGHPGHDHQRGAPVRRAAQGPGQQVQPRALRAGRVHRQPGDPDRQVDRGLHLPVARGTLPAEGRARRPWHHRSRGRGRPCGAWRAIRRLRSSFAG